MIPSNKRINNSRPKKIDPNAETKRITIYQDKELKEARAAHRIKLNLLKTLARTNEISRQRVPLSKASEDALARRIKKLSIVAQERAIRQKLIGKKTNDYYANQISQEINGENRRLMLAVKELMEKGIVSKNFAKKSGVYIQ